MKLRSGYCLISMILVFCILIGCGMGVYPGGTVMDPGAPRFLFWQNFLSDLGRVETFAGGSNQAARSFFIAALLPISIMLGIFLGDLRPALRLNSQHRMRRAFTIASWTTVLARAGVALTPWDRLGYVHLFFVQLTFFSGLVIGIMLLREARTAGSMLAPFQFSLRLWVGFQASYLLVLFFGPFLHVSSHFMLYIAAGSQKVLLLTECWVLAGLGWLLEKKAPDRAGAGTA